MASNESWQMPQSSSSATPFQRHAATAVYFLIVTLMTEERAGRFGDRLTGG